MPHTQRSGSEGAFRPEIEGLRAIAAALVAVFHIWLGRVSGGVDVFFVVSGFLITTGLLRQIERNGTPHLARFWGRLVKRLLPAALLVLCAVIIASVLLLPQSRWKETIKEVAASAVYLENWVLAFNSVDYLAQDGPVSPVQHFWALATQGQFYFAWPLLFVAVAYAARRSKLAFRSVAAATLWTIFAISLAFSIWQTTTNQPFAYFNTFARMWEFCIGGLLAVFIPRIQLGKPARVAAGWLGLLAILSCGLVLQVSRVFPGYAALWPTLGGALVIIAGTSGSAFGVDRFLGSRPMVYLGSISYAVYLWHFPILVFHRMYAAPEPVSFVAGLGILVASFVLAILTHRLVEQPVKQSDIGAAVPWRAFAFGAACLVPVVIGLAGWSVLYFKERNEEFKIVATGNPNYPGSLALREGFKYAGEKDVPVFPGPHSVLIDREYPKGEGCEQPYSSVQPLDCTIAGAAGMPTLAVVGGSHSAQWLPALQDIAAKAGWRIVTYTKSNCPFYLEGESLRDKEWKDCAEWNVNVLERLLHLQPDAVFTTATRYSEDHEGIPESYVKGWRAITNAGIRVFAVRDNPSFGTDVSACVELHGAASPRCVKSRQAIIDKPSPVELLRDRPENVHFVDFTDYFCTPTLCEPVVGNVMLYRDGNHITATYVRTLADVLHKEIARTQTMPPMSAHAN